jgi:hypothetical protein
MEIDRRLVLNGMVAAGLIGLPVTKSDASPARTSNATIAQDERRRFVLVNESAMNSTFLVGVGASPLGTDLEIFRSDLSMDFVKTLKEVLRSAPPTRIIGLVDDGAGAFIIQMARASGARLPWLGQHTAMGTHARHHIMQANQIGETAANLLSRARSWPEALGFTLVTSADGQRTPQPVEVSALHSPATPPIVGHFVSFVIESRRNS